MWDQAKRHVNLALLLHQKSHLHPTCFHSVPCVVRKEARTSPHHVLQFACDNFRLATKQIDQTVNQFDWKLLRSCHCQTMSCPTRLTGKRIAMGGFKAPLRTSKLLRKLRIRSLQSNTIWGPLPPIHDKMQSES